jgi:hypothetical protein
MLTDSSILFFATVIAAKWSIKQNFSSSRQLYGIGIDQQQRQQSSQLSHQQHSLLFQHPRVLPKRIYYPRLTPTHQPKPREKSFLFTITTSNINL